MAHHRQRRGHWSRQHAATRTAAALVVAAVLDQLRRPRDERIWHGRLGGLVPYELRRPTLRRLRGSLWAPDDPHLLLPRAFGVGWSPNLARVVHPLLPR